MLVANHVSWLDIFAINSLATSAFVAKAELRRWPVAGWLAALAGTGVWNAIIDIDGPEVPIMDGSAARFVQKIVAAGLRHLPGPRRAIRVLTPVRVEQGDAFAEIVPAPVLKIGFEIDFEDAAIGRQA